MRVSLNRGKAVFWLLVIGFFAFRGTLIYPFIGRTTDVSAIILKAQSLDFGNIKIMISINVFLCCAGLYVDTMKIAPEIIVRRGRKSYLNGCYLLAIKNALIFSVIMNAFTLVEFQKILGKSPLRDALYIEPMVLYFITTTLLLLIFVFTFVSVLAGTGKRQIAIVTSMMIWITLGMCGFVLNKKAINPMWYAFGNSKVLGDWIEKTFHWNNYILCTAYQIAILLLLYVIGHIAFKNKDVL